MVKSLATKLSPVVLKQELERLIAEARETQPNLSRRLSELYRWIAKKKNGLLNKKLFVIEFLSELIVDANLWFKIQMADQRDRALIFAAMNPCERFWHDCVFTAWVNESDPKLNKWKSKMMAGEYRNDDGLFIERVARNIREAKAYVLLRYILDLSMATDLLVSKSSRDHPLSVQLTSIHPEHLNNKIDSWQLTLRYWRFPFGLLISCNQNKPVQASAKVAEESLNISESICDGDFLIRNSN